MHHSELENEQMSGYIGNENLIDKTRSNVMVCYLDFGPPSVPFDAQLVSGFFNLEVLV